jgi:hypothetical protein
VGWLRRDARLRDTFREGEFSYDMPVPDGAYRVVAIFEEPVANAGGK